MCTVTYIPKRDSVIITSNRDEKNWRSPAVPPQVYDSASGALLYPKDADAGGTWIAAHENRNVVVFLNGGFVAHTPQPPYRKSRGLILLDILQNATPFNCFRAINLNNIEPFTAVIIDNGHLFECRWDGATKHSSELPADKPHIWSSVTLYNAQVIEKRNNWFSTWIAANDAPTQDDILHFHQFTGDGDAHNDLRMNRDGKVATVSVTSMHLSAASLSMRYVDLATEEHFFKELLHEPTMVEK